MNNITKFGFSAALIGLSVSVFAQSQSPRIFVVEEATQASCPPCAALNPALHSLLNANSTKSLLVAYQVWWPGVDAMYNDNIPEVQSRINTYYPDVNSAPGVIVNGSSGAQSTSYVTQARINTRYAESSEIDITLNASITGTMLTITGSLYATQAVTGDLKLRLIITEKEVLEFELAFPGSNTETEFAHVFKKFVNGPAGISLSNSWNPGDSYTINETFDLSTLNIYHYPDLEVVALVQDDDDKFILQAAVVDHLHITLPNTNTASINWMYSLPARVCAGPNDIAPIVKLKNTGNDSLTSVAINYSVNGGTPAVYNWTGSLSPLEREYVTLPSMNFEAVTSNIVNATTSNPNGAADDDTSDDSYDADPIDLAPTSDNWVTVKVRTDGWGNEVYWEVRNSGGTVVMSGGNPNVGTTNIGIGTGAPAAHPNAYGNNTLYEIVVPIDASDCYTYHITDFYGDGLLTGGYFRVYDNANTQIIGGSGSYTEVIDVYNGVQYVGIDEIAVANSLTLFPNPVADMATISFDLNENAKAFVEVLALTGQAVYTQNFGSLASGAHIKTLDLSSLSNGAYMVRITFNDQVVNTKITVAH
ncbi:MAG: T9SS type A sorting domain-containing protein [Flavobacteriales bacterium]|nr:T9SS type A sorting domain-containing protein [Flavobacteriales bacterium]MBK6945295.1 T9SS type A sorting domain-containing protein [Flavobacteriales bacterium]MBK7239645.1 T9SS type A sorting domain-containing protein [Flavobacteriales bacterium]MBK7298304.1 T9SS type A sorting domain-containing protein [Flavobacteriales bacterium]MBK9535148.1 T9SS type A sorting domain-containing protein [Flavobacteriales bacterium]